MIIYELATMYKDNTIISYSTNQEYIIYTLVKYFVDTYRIPFVDYTVQILDDNLNIVNSYTVYEFLNTFSDEQILRYDFNLRLLGLTEKDIYFNFLRTSSFHCSQDERIKRYKKYFDNIL